MQDQVAWALHRPGVEDLLLSMQSDTEAYFGRLKKARELSERAAGSAQHSDFKEGSALRNASLAVREAEFGNVEVARQEAYRAMALAPGRDVRLRAALALAQAGDVWPARKLADQLSAESPWSTLIQNSWLPTIRAEIELHDGSAMRAIELLRAAESYELSCCAPGLTPVYVRGKAYLRARQGAAAVEFQKLLEHRGIAGNNSIVALARLGLAHAFASPVTLRRPAPHTNNSSRSGKTLISISQCSNRRRRNTARSSEGASRGLVKNWTICQRCVCTSFSFWLQTNSINHQLVVREQLLW